MLLICRQLCALIWLYQIHCHKKIRNENSPIKYEAVSFYRIMFLLLP
jgi:hypothetical protein